MIIAKIGIAIINETITIFQPDGWYFNLDLQWGHFNIFGNPAL